MLHRLGLSTAEEQLSRVVFMAVPANMVMMSFPIGIGTAPVYCGIVLRSGEIMPPNPSPVSTHTLTDLVVE